MTVKPGCGSDLPGLSEASILKSNTADHRTSQMIESTDDDLHGCSVSLQYTCIAIRKDDETLHLRDLAHQIALQIHPVDFARCLHSSADFIL